MPSRESEFPLHWLVSDDGERLAFALEYREDRFSEGMGRRLARSWVTLLESVAADPSRSALDLEVVVPD